MSVTPYEDPATQGPEYATDPTGGRLVAWADALGAAHRIGSALCNTSFAPAQFRGKPEDAAAAIMFGDEIGLSPTQALRAVFVIGGTPSLYARQMAAVVMHHGHEVWTAEKSDAKVTVNGRRRGSQHVITETWTTARAQKAGYTNNKKYSTDPQAMLYARALSDVCRQIAPDALAGLAYTVEELELEDQPTTTVKREPERKTTARRAQPAPVVAADEPDLDEPEPTVAPEPQQPETDVLTPAQSKKMHALFGKLLDGDRAAGLKFASDVTGREVLTTKTLTKAEATDVIDALVKEEQAGSAAEPPADPEPFDGKDPWAPDGAA